MAAEKQDHHISKLTEKTGHTFYSAASALLGGAIVAWKLSRNWTRCTLDQPHVRHLSVERRKKERLLRRAFRRRQVAMLQQEKPLLKGATYQA